MVRAVVALRTGDGGTGEPVKEGRRNLAGIRCNVHLRAFYARLVVSGKLKKVALVAVMRKLLIHLNATCFNGGRTGPVAGR